MPLTINGEIHYQIAEAAKMAGISKTTLRRWIKAGKVNEASKKDVRGWRLFTQEDIQKIKAFAETTIATT